MIVKKIEIEIIERETGGREYNVRTDSRLADGLTFDEVLGLVASLTMPERRHCIKWLKTQEERDEQAQWLERLRERKGCDG